ncbi:hypothetical protein D3C81_1933370 [compost metagenome]
MSGHTGDGGRAEQVSAVLQAHGDGVGRIVHLQRQVELGLPRAAFEERHRKFAKAQGRCARGAHAPVEQGLEQRVGQAATVQFEGFEDQLDGVVGMLQRRQAVGLEAVEQLQAGALR